MVYRCFTLACKLHVGKGITVLEFLKEVASNLNTKITFPLSSRCSKLYIHVRNPYLEIAGHAMMV